MLIKVSNYHINFPLSDSSLLKWAGYVSVSILLYSVFHNGSRKSIEKTGKVCGYVMKWIQSVIQDVVLES